MEILGFILLSVVFIVQGFQHVINHESLVEYATPTFGNCPFANQLGYLSGWPTGGFLLATGIGIAFQLEAGLIAAAVFLAITQALFHRNYKDPANLKHFSLLGAVIAVLAMV